MYRKSFLALCLLLTLTACSAGEVPGSASPSPSDSVPSDSAPSDSASSSGSPAPSDDFDVNAYTRTLAGVDADTVMFTVNGEEVTAEYFFYWLSYNCYNWASAYPMYYGTQLDFNSLTPTGETFARYIKDDARTGAAVYVLLEQQAAANSCGLTDEQRAAWEQLKSEDRADNGEEAFTLFLRQMGLSEPMFDRIATMNNYLYQNLTDTVTSAPTPEEAEQYALDNTLYRAKHILIQTVVQGEDGSLSFYRGGAPTNEDGTAYTGTADEYNAAALARAADLLEQLNRSEDPLALFDRLTAEYSEDPGSAANPDGYFFGTGEMVREFEDAVAALDCEAYTAEPVQSVFGYHIILRLSPRPEDVESDFRSDRMSALLDGWLEDAEIVSTDAYDALDTEAFYNNYLAYQDSLLSADDGDPGAAPEN